MSNALLPANLSTPCIPWQGARSPENYGRIGGRDYAHRVAWEEASGEPIPAGLQVDHLCHAAAGCTLTDTCPHRLCVNTDHLDVVMQRTNLLRGNSPWAVNARKTECIRGHEFTPGNTLIHGGTRECRECARLRAKERYREAPRKYDVLVPCPICGKEFLRQASLTTKTCSPQCGWVVRRRRGGG